MSFEFYELDGVDVDFVLPAGGDWSAASKRRGCEDALGSGDSNRSGALLLFGDVVLVDDFAPEVDGFLWRKF